MRFLDHSNEIMTKILNGACNFFKYFYCIYIAQYLEFNIRKCKKKSIYFIINVEPTTANVLCNQYYQSIALLEINNDFILGCN